MIQSNRGKQRKEGRPWEAGEIKGLFQGRARGAFILLSQFIKTDRIASYIKTSPRILLAGNFSRAISTAPTNRCPISKSQAAHTSTKSKDLPAQMSENV
jgi:hypothetical protein